MLSPNSEYQVAKVWKYSGSWYVAFVEYVTVTFPNSSRPALRAALSGFICLYLGKLKFRENKYHPCLFEDNDEVIKYGQIYKIKTECLIKNSNFWKNENYEDYTYYELKEGSDLSMCLKKINN